MIRLSRLLLACLLMGPALPAMAQEAPAAEAPAPAAAEEDDFIRFVKAQQEPSKADPDTVDPAGLAMVEMDIGRGDSERAYYSGRDLASLMKQARDKTTAFSMSDFSVKGRTDTDRAVTVTYTYSYEATVEGVTMRATVESCETYEKRNGGWRLISGAYWHKAAQGAPPAPTPEAAPDTVSAPESGPGAEPAE